MVRLGEQLSLSFPCQPNLEFFFIFMTFSSSILLKLYLIQDIYLAGLEDLKGLRPFKLFFI